jgi:uncharacterized protein YkwD
MAEQNYFAHESPNGDTLADRARAAGFAGCAMGENIAQGQDTPEEVVQGWMDSDGHCANILSGSFDSLGVGFFDDPGAETRQLWVQNFGG